LKENIVLKHERIPITTAGKEAFRATAIFYDESSPFEK